MSKQYVTVETPIGTRVKCVGFYDNEYVVGKEGVIVYNDREDCIVEFDDPFFEGRKNRLWGFPASGRFLVAEEEKRIADEAINALLLGGE